jgi:hypothetical protein
MQRPVLLASKPKQMTYHRYPNVKLIQRKEDNNTVIQGEHCIVVLEEMETFIWDRCNGEYAIKDIVDGILALEDYCQNERSEIEEVVINYINDLLEQQLIEIT